MGFNYRNINLNYLTPLAGIAACFIISMGLYESASHYTGGAYYSPKNHFISELGLANASNYAHVFNLSLNIGGLLLLIFAFGLGRFLQRSRAAKLASVIGMTATLNFSAIGYYTADSWTAHKYTATVFFTGAMLSIALFSYAMFKSRQRRMHHFISLQGFIIAFVFFVVLAWPKQLLQQSVYDPVHFVRPELWGLTVLEWMYCLLIGSWIITVSLDLLYLLGTETKHGPQNLSGGIITG